MPAKHHAHRRLSRANQSADERSIKRTIERYQMKLALIHTYEACKPKDEEHISQLYTDAAMLRRQLQHKGVL